MSNVVTRGYKGGEGDGVNEGGEWGVTMCGVPLHSPLPFSSLVVEALRYECD